jgi:hypothetical protein
VPPPSLAAPPLLSPPPPATAAARPSLLAFTFEPHAFFQFQYLARATQDHVARRLADGSGTPAPPPGGILQPSTPVLDESTVVLRRARVSAGGFVATPRLEYFAEVDLGEGHVQVLEYRLRLGLGRGLAVNVGQMRVPFSRSWLTREERLIFPERDLATEQFRYDYDVGVSVEGNWLSGRLHAVFAGFNGGGASLGRNDNLDPVLVLRISGMPLGPPAIPDRFSISVGGGATLDYVPVPSAYGFLGGTIPPRALTRDANDDGITDGVQVAQAEIDVAVARRGLLVEAAGYLRREQWGDLGQRQSTIESMFVPRQTYGGFYAEVSQTLFRGRARAGARFALTELSPLAIGGKSYDAHDCLSDNSTIYHCALPYADERTEVTGLLAVQPLALPLWLSAMYSRLEWRSIVEPQPPSPGEHRVIVTAQAAF